MSEPPPRLFDSSAIVILQIFITMTWKQGHLFVDVMNVYDICLDSVICSMLYVLTLLKMSMVLHSWLNKS